MKKDELNNLNINNADGEIKVEENSLSKFKEIEIIPEEQKPADEVFQASEEFVQEEEKEKQSFDMNNNSGGDNSSGAQSAGATSATATVGVVGGVVGVIAVSASLVLGIVKLPVIPAVDVHLISASSSSLSFSLKTNIEDHNNLTISLSGVDYVMTTPFQEYVKFNNLKENTVYTLKVYEEETSRYSSKFYTNSVEEINDITIVVTSYIDDKLFFYFEDANPGSKMYTVNVKNSEGKSIFLEDTKVPHEYEIDDFKEDVAIFVSVNGTIKAGVQVFKPIYDYEHISWVWGDYGDTVTAIIPSLNDTDDYYVRDIRNFEIKREDATCTNDGYVIKQAAFIGPDKNRYEDERRFTLPALGHDFSDITYTWKDNYHTCTAEATCPECGSKIEESVEVEIIEVETDTHISFTKYIASFENENFSTRYHFEDLYYGNYPQSLVVDQDLLDQLNEYLDDSMTWNGYQYYANQELSSFMYYLDVDINEDGAFDYRALYFDEYRPISTLDELGNSSYQYDNGYLKNTIYWFKYEPIKWNVLDQDGNQLFINTDVILDSQSYHHEFNEEKFDHNGGFGFANNYELSDIRSWLNDEFYHAAFTEVNVVRETEVDNSISSTLDNENEFISNNTIDKIFLLSRYEAHEYLSNKDMNALASDYAQAQGLYIEQETGQGFYSLRTPYPNKSYQIRYITNNGNTSYDSIDKTSLGVRPACWINID